MLGKDRRRKKKKRASLPRRAKSGIRKGRTWEPGKGIMACFLRDTGAMTLLRKRGERGGGRVYTLEVRKNQRNSKMGERDRYPSNSTEKAKLAFLLHEE